MLPLPSTLYPLYCLYVHVGATTPVHLQARSMQSPVDGGKPAQPNPSHLYAKTRKHEKFKVNFANSEQLKKSSIIFMQNQLNSDAGQIIKSRKSEQILIKYKSKTVATYSFLSDID